MNGGLGWAGAGLDRVCLGGTGLGEGFAGKAWIGLCRVCWAGLGGAGLCRAARRRVRWDLVGRRWVGQEAAPALTSSAKVSLKNHNAVSAGCYNIYLLFAFVWWKHVSTVSTPGRNKPESETETQRNDLFSKLMYRSRPNSFYPDLVASTLKMMPLMDFAFYFFRFIPPRGGYRRNMFPPNKSKHNI